MIFHTRRCQRLLCGFLLLGCFIVSRLSLAVTLTSNDPELIDAAMISLGQSQQQFQNVGALFKVKDASCIGNVVYLGNQYCLVSHHVIKQSSEEYYVGFTVGDGNFTFYNIDKIDFREECVESTDDSISLPNVALVHLSADVVGLTELEISPRNAQFFKDNESAIFTHVGYGRIYGTEEFSNKRRAFQSAGCLAAKQKGFICTKPTPLPLCQSELWGYSIQYVNSDPITEGNANIKVMLFDERNQLIGLSLGEYKFSRSWSYFFDLIVMSLDDPIDFFLNFNVIPSSTNFIFPLREDIKQWVEGIIHTN